MKKVIICLMSAVSIFAFAQISGADNGSISGKVYIEGTSTPIADAQVYAMRQTPWWQSPIVLSGLDGSYNIIGLTPGKYALCARKSGFGAVLVTEIIVLSGQAVVHDLCMMANPGFIYGNLRDDTGAALPNYQIDACVKSDEQNVWFIATTTTDLDGNFTINEMAPRDDYFINAPAASRGATNYAPMRIGNISVLSGQGTNVNPIVKRAARIYGQIEDASTHLPIQGVNVNAYVDSQGLWGGDDFTDENGEYELKYAAPGYLYTINVTPRFIPGGPNYAMKRVYQNVQTLGDYNLNIQMELGAISITGMVTDKVAGQPLENIRIGYWNEDENVWRDAYTDASGYYALHNLPKGIARVTAEPQYNYAQSYFIKDFQSDDSVNFALAPEAVISGAVKDADTGELLRNVAINYELRIMHSGGRTYTDSSGNFTLRGLPKGILVLTVRPDVSEEYSWKTKYFYVAEGERKEGIELLMRKGALVTGTALEAIIPNQPINHASVLAPGVIESLWSGNTDVNGHFSLRLPPGEHKISFSSGNYGDNPWVGIPARFSINDINDGRDITLYGYDMDTASHITGEINNPSLYPKTSAFMIAAFEAGDIMTTDSMMHIAPISMQIIADDSGPYDLLVPPARDYDLYLCVVNGIEDGMNACTVRQKLGAVPAGAIGGNFSYDSAGGTITGAVTADGDPVIMAVVFLEKSDGAIAAFGTTDENGVYNLYNVPALQAGESYSISAYEEDLGTSPELNITGINDNDTITRNIPFDMGYLKLWNELDSDEIVCDSAVGPDGVIQGSLEYSPAKFSSGVTNANADSYISFDNSVFNTRRGAIEFWFKTDFDVVDGCARGGGQQKWWITQSGYTQTGDYSYFFIFFDDEEFSGRMGIGLTGRDNQGVLIYPYLDPDNHFDWNANELHHFAVSYDKSGIDKGKTFIVCLDGVEIANSNEDWGVYNKGTAPIIVNNNIAQMTSSHSTIDNIKIWSFAKTDFSDRLYEGNLRLWNKLGSDEEAHNSAIGPGGCISGQMSYDDLKYAGGITNDDDQSFITFSNSCMDGEYGTIEFWFKTDFDVQHGRAVIPNGLQKWWFVQDSRNNDGNGAIIIFFDEGVMGCDNKLRIWLVGDRGAVTIDEPDVSWRAHEAHHFALSYDVNNIYDGKKAILFIDGEEAASASEDWGDYDKGSTPIYLSNFANDPLYGGWKKSYTLFDNIKIWDYAKTNFADRFAEGYAMGPMIGKIDPASASVNELVMIYGFNFGDAQGNGYVDFYSPESGSARAQVLAWSDDRISCRIPEGARSGNVYVTTDLGTSNCMYMEIVLPVSAVTGRHIFYNNSSFDGNYAQPDERDDNAIAADKQALLLGHTAAFSNYTSFDKGINGVMVDIENLREPGNLTAGTVGDYFRFNIGNDNLHQNWPAAENPSMVSVRLINENTYRVTLIWDDRAILKTWLKVTILANAHTGLAGDDIFFLGNAVGETGNSASDAKVNAFDMLGARDNPRTFLNPAPITFAYDFNRDKKVNAIDMLIARDNPTTFLNALRLIIVED